MPGPIIRRVLANSRPNGFSAPAIANLLMWFDASTIAQSDGSAIAQWNDVSGNANHAVQATGAAQPLLKKNQLNGKAAVAFNLSGGTARYLDVPNVMGSPAGAEYFAVFQSDADPAAIASTGGMLTLSGVAADQNLPYTNGNVYETFGSLNNNHITIPKSINVATTGRIINTRVSANYCTVRLNGDIIHEGSYHTMSFANTTRSIGRGLAGGGNFWRGYVYEILVYNTQLTAAQRAVVNAYLVSKYNLSGVSNVTTLFTPTSYAGLKCWFKADQLVLNDGDPVSTWADQSGNGLDITNSGAARPTYKTNVLNSSHPAVRFTSTQMLNFASDVVININSPFAVLAVGQYTTDCALLGHGSFNFQCRFRRGGVNQMSMFPGGGSEAITATYAHTITDAYLATFRRVGTSSFGNMLMNGDVDTNLTSISSNALQRFSRIGGGVAGTSVPLVGDVSEICVWDTSTLTDLQVFNLYETYFRSRWGLP